MSEPIKNIFSQLNECLTEEQMKHYVQGLLTPLETKQVESHLLDCEFCSDAVEGLRQSGMAPNLHSEVVLLNKKLDKKYRHHRNQIIYSPWRIIAIAASVMGILLGVGIYFNLFVNTRLQVVADKLETLKHQISSIADKSTSTKDTLTIISEKNQTAANSNTSDAFDNSPLTELQPNEVTNADSINTVTNNLADANETKSEGVVGNATVAKDEEAKPGFTTTASIPSNAMANNNLNQIESASNDFKNKASKKSLAEADKAPANLADAVMPTYNSKNYQQAVNQFLPIVTKDGSNLKARYYLGMSYFNLEKYIDAIKQFDNIMLQSNDEFYEEARFQKALAHIKIDDELTARAIFQQIIAENSPYKTQAEAKLNELK